jgi:hypothetical protein
MMENRYKGKWGGGMLVDYCWMANRDAPEDQYKWKGAQFNSCMLIILSCNAAIQ